MARMELFRTTPSRTGAIDEFVKEFREEFGVPEPQPNAALKLPSTNTGLQLSADTIYPISKSRTFRKIQLVWEELHSLGSLVIPLHSANHGAARPKSPSRLLLQPRSKPLMDEDGPHIINALPKVAHWALRVEKESGKGDREDVTSWQYFSLRQTGGKCYLDMNPFKCPDGRDKLWDSFTEFNIEEIEACAQHLIAEAGKYNLLGNNCQNFAANLLVIIMSVACPHHRLAQMLLDRNLITKERISDLDSARVFALSKWGETCRTSEGKLVFGTTLEINTLAECLRPIFLRIGLVKIPVLPILDTKDLEDIRNARKTVEFEISAEDLNKTVHQDIERWQPLLDHADGTEFHRKLPGAD